MISQSVQTSFVPLSALPRAFRLCFFFALIASVFVPSWPVFHVNSFLSLPQFTDILLLLLLFWHPDSILCWIHVCLLLMIPNTYSSTLGSELSWNFLIACTLALVWHILNKLGAGEHPTWLSLPHARHVQGALQNCLGDLLLTRGFWWQQSVPCVGGYFKSLLKWIEPIKSLWNIVVSPLHGSGLPVMIRDLFWNVLKLYLKPETWWTMWW